MLLFEDREASDSCIYGEIENYVINSINELTILVLWGKLNSKFELLKF